MKYLELSMGVPVLEQCPECKRKTLQQFAGYNIAKPKYKGRCLITDCLYNVNREKYIDSLPAGIPKEWVTMSMQTNRPNTLDRWLSHYFGKEKSFEAFKKYKIGTAKKVFFNCWPIFWQIDEFGNVVSGRVHHFIESYKGDGSGFRIIASPKGRREYKSDEQLYLFGLHLLASNKDKPIMIYSYERRAVEASIEHPDWNCLAFISKDKRAKERVKNRFPDAVWF